MSLFFVKLLDFAAKPLGISIVVILLGLGVSGWSRPTGLTLVLLGLLFLWVCATPWMGNTLVRSLEGRFPPKRMQEVPDADAIVALGGGIGPATPPRRHPDLNAGADRIWHAARLYHAGVAPFVIVSGGNPPQATGPSAPAMKTVLTSWDVPADSILLESESKTTHGNAVHTSQLCEERSIDTVVLVTSAAHMRRALEAFRSTAPRLTITPAPTDYRAVREPFTLLSLVPDANSLLLSTIAFHEYVGYLYYRWRGWIEA